jgi:endonuclease/exonuclease/phosphatase family metal-dependent hydrolase
VVEPSPIPIRVLSFNICLGGEAVDIAQVAAAIVASGADVVGLQEAGANAPLIARLVGFAHVDERHQVISRWPIAEPSDADGAYVFVHPVPNGVVAIGNIHLPAEAYGPYLLRDGHDVEDVIEVEWATRLSALHRFTAAWSRLIEHGVPLVVTGDFNVPAHTDWGPDWTEHRDQPVPWPVSHEMTTLGFTDTYRAANPTVAGLTWTYGYPHPLGNGLEPRDRIDFVWSSGHREVARSHVVGPAGVPDVGVAIDPWPSDHLGVVSELVVAPVEPAPFVAPLDVRIEVGDLLRVRFTAAGTPTDRVCLVAADGALDDALMWIAPMEVERFGQVNFGTAHLAPGAYDVVLDALTGEIGRGRVWIVGRHALPSVEARFDGDALRVSWNAAPSRKFDWVGVYRPDDPDLENGRIGFAHTEATVAGEHVFEGLGDGPFTVRLFTDDSLVIVAQTQSAPG